MAKLKYIIPLLLVVLVGASCEEKGNGGEKGTSLKKGVYTLAEEGVFSEKGCLKVSGDGESIVYFFDADGNGQADSIVISDPMGKDKKTIEIKGGLLDSKTQIDTGSLAIDDAGEKVVFSATPPCEREEYACPEYIYVLNVSSESLTKIKNQDLADKCKGAGWADPQEISISPDGKKIAFTIRFWGIDFGAAYDVSAGLAVVNSDGTGSDLLKEDKEINTYYIAINDSYQIFFGTKGAEKYEYILTRINSDGSDEKKLGVKLSSSCLSVSSQGRVSGVLDKEDEPAFVCDFQGNIIGEGGNPWGHVEITGNGEKVLAAEWDKGLVFYQADNNFEKEQVLDASYGNCAVHDVDNSGQVIVCRVYKTGEVLAIIR